MFDRTFHIHTIGCQMNVYDADLMANALMAMGYRPVADPEAADLAIVNTCAIREKAEQKVYSLLGRLAGIKRRRPEMRLAVGGCVAQLAGRRIQRRAPYVDLVFGTRAIERLPGLVRRLEAVLAGVTLTGPSRGRRMGFTWTRSVCPTRSSS